MAASAEYRSFAEERRRAGGEASLPQVRMRHLAAADSWERIAQEQELFELTRRPRPEIIC